MRFVVTIVAMAAIAGCAGNPAPVPVEASRADLSALAGRWEGTYESAQTGRTGHIEFTLAAGHDTATGDVIMIPANHRQGVQSNGASPPRPDSPPPPPDRLTIHFVSIHGTEVVGTLDPYRDPDCGCMVVTTFAGTAEGSTIKGRYDTRGEGVRPSHGRWEVLRTPKPE